MTAVAVEAEAAAAAVSADGAGGVGSGANGSEICVGGNRGKCSQRVYVAPDTEQMEEKKRKGQKMYQASNDQSEDNY